MTRCVDDGAYLMICLVSRDLWRQHIRRAAVLRLGVHVVCRENESRREEEEVWVATMLAGMRLMIFPQLQVSVINSLIASNGV